MTKKHQSPPPTYPKPAPPPCPPPKKPIVIKIV